MTRKVVVTVLCAVLIVGYGVKQWVDSERVFGNVWNSDAVNMMIGEFHRQSGHYPARLHEMDSINVDPMEGPGPAQDLDRNLWGQRYVYMTTPDGGYTFISPGRHGYAQTDRMVPWPRYEGPTKTNTSLIFKSAGKSFIGFLGLPKGQDNP